MIEKNEKKEMGMNEWVVYDVFSWNVVVFFFMIENFYMKNR